MRITLDDADTSDVSALVALRLAVAQELTDKFGRGGWSHLSSETGVLSAMRNTRFLVARRNRKIIGALQLTAKKPWAIDRSYFTKCQRPIYLIGMAVEPSLQRRGIGRAMIEDAKRVVREWPGDALCLDAWDAAAGAGEFYAKCGFKEVGRATYRGAALIYYEMLLAGNR